MMFYLENVDVVLRIVFQHMGAITRVSDLLIKHWSYALC